jgi:long-chain fatty acid transport protein
MFNITPETRLGAHYRSKTKFTLAGDIQFQNAPTFATAGPLGALGTGLNANFANGNVQADIELPDTATIGLSHNFTPKLQVLFDYTWTGWSSIQYLSIYRQNDGSAVTSTPLQFNNSWRVGLGANYQLTDQWKLRLGVAYDTTPVQDQYRTPRLPDSDRTWLAIGAQYAMTKQLALDFGYAYLFAADANSNLPNLETDLPSGFRASPKGNLVGNYTANVNILTAGVRYSF